MLPKIFGAVLLSGLSCMALAQDTTQTLDPIEVRAIRPGDTHPFAQSRLSKTALQKQNLGQDIPYLLGQTPSTVVTSDAGAGIGYTGIRIRGTDGTRINATLNGVPINDAESQGTFFVNFGDLASSLSSLQIQRGVGSSTHGVGSFGATLSMSNLDNLDSAGATLTWGAGSFGTRRVTAQAGTGWLHHRFALDVRLSYITSQGFIDRASSILQSLQMNGAWKINAHTQVKALAMLGKEKTGQAWNGIPEEKLRGNEATLKEHYQNNVSLLYFTPQDSTNLFSAHPRRYNYFTYPNQTDNYQQDYYQLHGHHLFSEKFSANLSLFLTRGRGYYEEYKHNEKLSSYGLPPFITPAGDTLRRSDLIRQLWLDNYFYGSLLSLFYNTQRTHLTLGGGLTQYDGGHYGLVKWAQYGVPADHRWYNLSAHKQDAHVFLKTDRQWGKLTVYGDLQMRHVAYTMKGFRKNPSLMPQAAYTFFNPKAGLSFALLNRDKFLSRAYASIALASKEPNREDFEASPITQPRPEQLTDIEGGLSLTRKNLWNAVVNLFWMQYQDQLILTGKVNDVGAYTRTNVPESYRAGIELMADAAPTPWLQISANATFSQNKIKAFTEYIDNYDDGTQQAILHHDKDIAFSPALIAALGLRFYPLQQKKALEISCTGKHVGRQYLDNTQHFLRSLKPYTLADVGATLQLGTWLRQEMELKLQVLNVLNHQYESNGYTFSYIYGARTYTSNYYYPQAGRHWMMGVSMKW